jgi:SAM-dependent methyltransferase
MSIEPKDRPSEVPPPKATTQERALASGGTSGEAIYRLVARVIRNSPQSGGTIIDVGCGGGLLRNYVRDLVDEYIGVDTIRYDDFPTDATFRMVDLDTGRVDEPDGAADIVTSVETIEHLENPRSLVRELVRLVRPGGLILITTPNQVNLLSKLGLLVKDQFPAFQERPGLYPAHITALLPIDLLRIARECGLVDPMIRYTDSGRIPGTARHWPRPFRGRLFSDNVLLVAHRPN